MTQKDTPAPLDAAELIRTQWNVAAPQQTEQRFRELSARAFQQGDEVTALQLQTQVARAQGLDERFAEASATLADVEARSEGQPAIVRVRLWLEQGRAHAELSKDAGLARKEGDRLQRIGRLGGVVDEP